MASELEAGMGIIIDNGVISVDITELVEFDNPLPVSSNAVYQLAGEVETLLREI